VAVVAFIAQHGDVRALERLDDAGDLELVGDRVRDHGVAADGATRLQRLEAGCARARFGGLGQHRAIRGDARHRVERAIDLLVAERRHRRAIRARIHERDPGLGLLEQRAALGGE
jgi:hypothetical protein